MNYTSLVTAMLVALSGQAQQAAHSQRGTESQPVGRYRRAQK
jgi:hypothetical protein